MTAAAGGAVEEGLLLSTLPPGRRQVLMAAAVVALLLAALAVTVPYARMPVPGSEAFLPAYATAVLINDVITSSLLFALYTVQRSRAMLLLAAGYLFAGITAVPWALTFPGVFPPLGALNDGLQSTAWIAAVRRLVFPLFVIAYAVLRRRPPPATPSDTVFSPVAVAVLATLAASALLTWAAVAGEAVLPRFMADARNTTGLWIWVPLAATLLAAAAVGLLARGPKSVLDLWLIVVMITFLVELALLSFLSSGRFSVGWWSGRFVGLVSASIVLLVLLAEATALHARLARSVAGERRAREARLATMEALSASIAHEVNQPLASMVTNADAALRWLARDPPDLDEVRAALGRITGDGHRAGEVVASIRGLFRAGGRDRGPLDVNAVVREALRGMEAETRAAAVAVEAHLEPALPTGLGDAVQIRQVVSNLVTNAVQALGALPEPRRAICVRTETDGFGNIHVAVEDRGGGLDDALRERIFEPFFTTKVHGMGLGLMFCRSVIEAHGGRLWVTENVPHGAVFRFTLPIAEEAGA